MDYYNLTNSDLEALVLAHRYLYYILGNPIISDYKYDKLEKFAITRLSKDSPVNTVGSDLLSSYSELIISKALQMQKFNQSKSL